MKKTITPKPDLKHNNISDVDSYKFSHFPAYVPGMSQMMSYLESRGGEFDTCTLFGLQVILHRYLSKAFTFADVDEEQLWAINHGVPFNRDGFLHILNRYDGKMPVKIRAIPEGLVVPVKNVIMTVESVNDPKCFWITNWLETKLSRVWYPSVIAIASRETKKVWKHYLDMSSDDTNAEISFKHHDFGSRGVTCLEQAEMGGAAHLLSFLGSDTVAGIKCANHYYDEVMAGFSIPATEHSTMTVWGRNGEREALRNWISKMLIERNVMSGLPKLAACVADSYNVYEFIKMVCEDEFLSMIKDSDGSLVIRPDSGDPLEVLPKILDTFETHLPEGDITVNSKGYKLLPSCIRLIWGDGINRRSTGKILESLVDMKWSASNLALGSGGGLLMDVNRDTQKFAFKCCHALVNYTSVDVRKDPITDPGKRSKTGRLDLIMTPDGYKTVAIPHGLDSHPHSVMNTVFDVGDITYHTTFEECRHRMAL